MVAAILPPRPNPDPRVLAVAAVGNHRYRQKPGCGRAADLASAAMDATRRSIDAWVIGLVAGSALLQVGALVARSDAIAEGTTGRHVFSTGEMAFVLALLVQGWRIVRWTAATQQPDLVVRVARLCLVSLALCAAGDLVNRNYLEQHYQWDHVLRASFLITAIWCFFPGYAVIIGVNRLITRSRVTPGLALGTAAIGAVVGLGAYASNHDPAMSHYASGMILAYTVMLSVLGASTIWLVRTFGWSASWVPVVGCLLALVADAIIGNFWIYRDHFPTVEHVNWIPYFASLAMIQRLTFLVADHPGPGRAAAAGAPAEPAAGLPRQG